MIKAGRAALLLVFIVCAGGMMFAAGEPLLRVVLVVGGLVVVPMRVNAVLDRSRLRRGRPVDHTTTMDDLTALARRDWQELAMVLLVGAGLCLTGLLAF